MKKKVLLVENNADYSNSLKTFLEDDGDFLVEAAETIDDARELLKSGHFHLVICDIRMEEDSDEQDTSGLDFIVKEVLGPIKVIITANPSAEHYRNAWGKVDEIIEKGDPDFLFQKLTDLFEEKINANFGLDFTDGSRLPISLLYIAQELFPNEAPEIWKGRSEQIEFLFMSLFPNARMVRFDRIFWYVKNPTRIAVSVFVFEGDHRPVSRIVVFGEPKHIEKEHDNFQSYRKQDQHDVDSLSEVVQTTHIAAHAYALSESLKQLVRLENVIKNRPFQIVRTVIQNLFEKTLKPWYETSTVHDPQDMSEWYQKRMYRIDPNHLITFGDRCNWLEQKLPGFQHQLTSENQELVFKIEGKEIKLPHPSTYYAPKAFRERLIRFCNTSGYIHWDKVLTDREERSWVTDFYDSGPAPWIRDYASVEAAVRFDWHFSTDHSAKDMYEFEYQLTFGDFHDPLELDPENKLFRPLNAIKAARDAMGDDFEDFHAYQLCLFFHIAKRLVEFDPESELIDEEANSFFFMLLSASLIVAFLEGQVQPPKIQTVRIADKVSHGDNSINPKTREVTIYGKSFKLSKNRFKVYAHLFNHLGEVCKRQDVGRSTWKDYEDSDRKDALKLNTLMTHLRTAIEDKDKNRPIIESIDNGYRLSL